MKPFPAGSIPLCAFALSVVLLPGARPAFAHVASDRQIQELSLRIEREPGNAALHLRRGELHRAERTWPAALADYESARKLAPGLAAVDLCQARMHLDAGQPEEARRWADRFLARQPDHVQALLTRARASARLGERLRAVADFTRAIDLCREPQRPLPEHYLERARALADAGREHLDAALRGLDAGIARLGPIITLESAAIELELRAERYDGALRRVDAVVARWPRKELWLVKRGEILEEAGRLPEARQAFAAARQAFESLPPHRRKARFLSEYEAHIDAALTRLAGAKP
jgi:predicted Zn-dependent protease